MPVTGSMWILAMASGLVSATSSISTPPSADSMPRCSFGGRPRARLAAATDLHLGLDHDGVARGLGLLDGLVHRVGHASLGGGDAEAGEGLLALVLGPV